MDLSDPQMGELVNAQEKLWAGDFGDEYAKRCVGRVESNTFFFSRILRHIRVKSYIEFGAGTGENIAAMQRLFSDATAHAVEINKQAAAKIDPTVRVYRQSMINFTPVVDCDLSFTKGCLIHINPDDLTVAYNALYTASRRYILIAEYYNPTPVEVPYRGEMGRMWKRDHAGEMMDLYPDLRLVDYGFQYHRGEWPQDDLNWFLMEKR